MASPRSSVFRTQRAIRHEPVSFDSIRAATLRLRSLSAPLTKIIYVICCCLCGSTAVSFAKHPWGDNVARARILLADDHKEIRDRAVRLLEPQFDVVGTVADGNALVRASAQLKPDVCVIDISMPLLNGIDAAIKMKKNGSEAIIVFLTVNEDSDFVRAAIRIGALGYVVKSRMATDLCAAINGAINGRLFVSPSCIFSVDPNQRTPLP